MVVLIGVSLYRYGYVRVKDDLAALREDEAVKMRVLEKYVTLIDEKPALEKRLAAMKEERKAEEANLIEGQTPSLSAAALQDTVKGIITGRGGTISSERVSKPEDRGRFKVISISIDAVLPDTRALEDVLYSIETRTPNLLVKELDTRVRNFREPRDLMVKLDVSALTGGK
jgi:hypothetical protein